MGRSWVSASARVPFTPFRVGHTFGGGSRRTTSDNTSPETTGYAGIVVLTIFMLAVITAYPIQSVMVFPLVATIGIALHAHFHPDTKLAQWWIELNDHFRSDKRALKNQIGENDITIETGTE